MPAGHDLDPDAMTDDERLEKRRFEAGFAFEMMPQAEYEARNANHRPRPKPGAVTRRLAEVVEPT